MMPLPLSVIVRPVKYVAAGVLIASACLWAVTAIEQSGYDRREDEYQLERAEIEKAVEQAILTGVTDAAKREAQAIQQLEDIRHNAGVRIKTLTQHLKRERNNPDAIPDTAYAADLQTGIKPPACVAESIRPHLGDVVLDNLTVRVLNEARAGIAAPEAGYDQSYTDATLGTAPSTPPITGADLAINDLEVVQKYHELAARHDGLIDWVNAQCIDPEMQK